MSSSSERRGQADRRNASRGGRRPQDRPGLAPLVLVVGNGGPPLAESEAILRELKFAVAPAADLSEAQRVLESLQPDLIVARTEDVSKLRAAAVPVVEYASEDTADGRLVERLRDALRTRRRSR